MFKKLVGSSLLLLAWASLFAQTGELIDPMRPVLPGTPTAKAVEQQYKLTATLVSDARRVAIVNGRPARVGDVVDDAVIVAVEHSSVELRRGSRTFTVSLARSSSRSQSEGEPES